MTVETTTPRSRRAILAAALGAGAATIASALGRPSPVSAHDPDDVRLGADNTNVGHRTLVATTAASNADAIVGVAYGATSGSGVVGQSTTRTGVVGYSGSGAPPAGSIGIGVYGLGDTGVSGESTSGNGLVGSSTSGVGVVGSSTSGTGVYGSSDSYNGVWGLSNSNVGVAGSSGSSSGVAGTSTSGTGVQGLSLSGSGVVGESSAFGTSGVKGQTKTTTSDENYGVYGETHGPASRSVFGRAMATSGGTGAWGQADSPSGTGVRGLAWNANGGTGGYGTGVIGSAGSQAWPAARVNTGVMGVSPGGTGVFGSATAGTGAYGYATSGIGSRGYAATGTAGYFSTSGTKVGTALRVLGKVKLDNCAGVATIAAGAKSVVVTPGIDLLATSAVVATLMTDLGTTTVRCVVVSAAADTFTINLTANATTVASVAWIVLG